MGVQSIVNRSVITPAISNFLMIGRGYRVFGTFEPKVNLRLNTACGSQMGEYTIQFDRYATNSVRFQMMTCEIHGVTYGERTFEKVGKGKYLV